MLEFAVHDLGSRGIGVAAHLPARRRRPVRRSRNGCPTPPPLRIRQAVAPRAAAPRARADRRRGRLRRRRRAAAARRAARAEQRGRGVGRRVRRDAAHVGPALQLRRPARHRDRGERGRSGHRAPQRRGARSLPDTATDCLIAVTSVRVGRARGRLRAGRGSRGRRRAAITPTRLGSTPRSTSPRSAFQRVHASASPQRVLEQGRAAPVARCRPSRRRPPAAHAARVVEQTAPTRPAATSASASTTRRAATWRSARSGEAAAARIRSRSAGTAARSDAELLPRLLERACRGRRRVPAWAGTSVRLRSGAPTVRTRAGVAGANSSVTRAASGRAAVPTDRDGGGRPRRSRDRRARWRRRRTRRTHASTAGIVDVGGRLVPTARSVVDRRGDEPDRARVRGRLGDDGTRERRTGPTAPCDLDAEHAVAPAELEREVVVEVVAPPTAPRADERGERGVVGRRSTAGRRRTA